jgi:hypothetical protein
MDSSLIAPINNAKGRRFLVPEKNGGLTPLSEALTSGQQDRKAPSAIFYHSSHSSQSIYTAKSGQVEAPQKPQNGSDIAAGNILSFIDRQLALDVADGASQEELTSRIEAGLSGFIEGFGSAKDQIESLRMLDDKLGAELKQTYDKVLSGIESLKEKYLEGYQAPAPKTESNVSEVNQPVKSNGLNSDLMSVSAAQKNQFEFSVTTEDGDIVTLNASSLQAWLAENISSTSGTNSISSSLRSSYSESNLFFSVEGELDSGEMKAINDLFLQVNDLAETFFSGNFQAAFEEAMKLGYDAKELASFSLNLTQTSVQRATSAYQAQNFGSSNSESGLDIEPLANYARELVEAVKTASMFQYPERLINNLAGMFELAYSDGFKDSLMSLLTDDDEAVSK